MGVHNTNKAISTVVYENDSVRIGHFHLAADDPHFQDAGAIFLPTLVFPRTPTYIKKEHRRKYLSEPNYVNVYDGHKAYSREVFDQRGDICDWFEFKPEILTQVLSQEFENTSGGFLDLDTLYCEPETYLFQRQLLRYVCDENMESDAVQELIYELLDRVFASMLCDTNRPNGCQNIKLLHHDISLSAQKILVERISENVSIEDLANQVGVSAFHLCRIFKKTTNMSVHGYRKQLRLNLSLDQLLIEKDITKVAIDLGFASHSHFSTAFSSAFKLSPREYRKHSNAQRCTAH